MIFYKGKPSENGVNYAKHHNKLKIGKNNFMIKEHDTR